MSNLINDVSKYQGTIDWAAQAAARDTAIIRGHNGWVQDPTFAYNRAQAHAHGLKALGIYQYVTSGKDVTAQANQFCATIGSLKPNEFVMADLEDAAVNGGLASALHVWCTVVEARLGGHALIYTGDYLADALPTSVTGGRLRMLAAYRTAPPDHAYDVWQYTDSASAPGIASGCDQSRTNLTAAGILARTRGGLVSAPPPVAHFNNYNPASFGWTVQPSQILPFTYEGVTFPQGVHKLAAPAFRHLLDVLRAQGAIPKLYNPGCWGYEARPITGGTSLSFHAYGLALDLDAPDNAYSASGAFSPHTISDAANAVARGLGFEWGGGWSSPKDYMHFECHLSPADVGRVNTPTNGPPSEDPNMPLNNADKKWIHDDIVAVLRGENVSFPRNGRPIVITTRKYTRPAALWNGFEHRVLSSPQWSAVQGLVDIRFITEAKYDELIPPKPPVVVTPPPATPAA